MFKLLIPLVLLVVMCFFAGDAGLKLLAVIAVSMLVGGFVFFAFRFVTSKIGCRKSKNRPFRSAKKVPEDLQALDKQK